MPELDLAVETALAAGALRRPDDRRRLRRLRLALVDDDATDQVAGAVTEAFASHGFAAPAPFVATPAPAPPASPDGTSPSNGQPKLAPRGARQTPAPPGCPDTAHTRPRRHPAALTPRYPASG